MLAPETTVVDLVVHHPERSLGMVLVWSEG